MENQKLKRWSKNLTLINSLTSKPSASRGFLDRCYREVGSKILQLHFIVIISLMGGSFMFPTVASANERTPEVQKAIDNMLRAGKRKPHQLHLISAISIPNTKLSHFKSGDLDGLTGLLHLMLYNNKLNENSFPKDLFSETRLLDTLYLDKNEFTEIGANFAESLPSLKNLYLGQNKIETVKHNFFEKLPETIKLLALYNNQLSENSFPRKPFSGRSSLNSLSLQGNKFTRLDGDFALSLPPMRDFNLGKNLIKTVEQSFFENLPKTIKKLDLSFNRIKSLPEEIYNLTQLESLDLRGNPLSKETKEKLKRVFSSNVLKLPPAFDSKFLCQGYLGRHMSDIHTHRQRGGGLGRDLQTLKFEIDLSKGRQDRFFVKSIGSRWSDSYNFSVSVFGSDDRPFIVFAIDLSRLITITKRRNIAIGIIGLDYFELENRMIEFGVDGERLKALAIGGSHDPRSHLGAVSIKCKRM